MSVRELTFVVPGDIETRTGGYEYDRRLIDALGRRGWDVRLVQLAGDFPSPGNSDRAAARRSLEQIPDGAIVLFDGLAFGALADEVMAHTTRLNMVALVHHPLALETGLPPETAAQLAASERRALQAARHVVVTSPATAELLDDYGVSASRRTVVVPGTGRNPARSQSSSSEVRLLCVGTLIPRKGHDVLIEALTTLTETRWRLICAGSLTRDPETAVRIQALAGRSGLDSRVEFVGELSERQLDAEYARADVFVLPTRYEGYGMVAAEAIAHGLPVIATDTGGIREIVGSDAGLLVTAGDVTALAAALRRVITDAAFRRTLAAGALRALERLPTWDAAAERMEAVLLQAGRA